MYALHRRKVFRFYIEHIYVCGIYWKYYVVDFIPTFGVIRYMHKENRCTAQSMWYKMMNWLNWFDEKHLCEAVVFWYALWIIINFHILKYMHDIYICEWDQNFDCRHRGMLVRCEFSVAMHAHEMFKQMAFSWNAHKRSVIKHICYLI